MARAAHPTGDERVPVRAASGLKSGMPKRDLILAAALLSLPFSRDFSFASELIGAKAPYFRVQSGDDGQLTPETINGKLILISYETRDMVENNKSLKAALNRIAPGRSSVIELYNQSVSLEDGRTHGLEWRRGTDGEMVVLPDGKEIIRTVDRASEESFDGFTVVNRGGDYAFSRVAIFGWQK